MRDAHYSFVVDRAPRFGYQAYLLARSLIDLGNVVPTDISAHLVRGTNGAVEQALRELGIRTEWVEPFGHPYCNRLQQLPSLLELYAAQFILLDTDMFAVRPLELPSDDAVWGKPVDAPNPPIEVLEAIYRTAGVVLETSTTDVIPGPTARANFNGGLYIVPKAMLAGLTEAWTQWARWSLGHMDLYGESRENVDQTSFALAVAQLGVPTACLGREFNTPTHLGPVSVGARPFFLHYHRNVDDQLLLATTGDGGIDAAIDTANWAISKWRKEDLSNGLFWGTRYELHPELGSGVGSRGETLIAKRLLIERLINLFEPASVVDIGGGDGMTLQGLAEGRTHTVTDVAAAAATPYRSHNPAAQFVESDITQESASEADLAVCLDVLIHVSDPRAFRAAVRNVVASGRIASLVSGFDQRPTQTGGLTYFHEPLLEAIEADPEVVAYPLIAYRELVGYLVQRDAGTGHPRDAAAPTLRRAMAMTHDAMALLECVVTSRRELGFFPDHLPRCLEYPWLLRHIRAAGRTGLRIIDVGAGVNVLPLILAGDGHWVTTVDAHPLDRTSADRLTWNEWGYLDYSSLRPGIASFHSGYEQFVPVDPADVIYSISVIEHLPAATRRVWLARMAEQLGRSGRLLLTVDLQPMTRTLWLRAERVDVEAADQHGDLDALLDEIGEAGFLVEDVEVREWLPLSRVGVAMIAARRVDPAGAVVAAPVRTEAQPQPATTLSVAGSHSSPVVTVCVPAYRPNQRFVGLLESLASQTSPHVLIRVSLDHDPECELPQLPDLRGKQLELIRQPRRLGWVGNVNALLRTVATPYFLLLMHDDQLTPRYIEAAVEVLEQRPEVVVAHGSVRHHGIRDGVIDFTDSISGARMERLVTFLNRAPHRAGHGWRGVVRSELIERGLRLRSRRSDGMLSNDLWMLEMLVHGESVFVPDIYYDKYTDPDGLSRDYHHRTYQEKSRMLADSVACMLDVLRENGFTQEEQADLAARYVEWLLGLQGNWNVVSEDSDSNAASYAQVRPAIARFVANVALSVASDTSVERVSPQQPTHLVGQPGGDRDARWLPSPGAHLRSRLTQRMRRAVLKLPHLVRRNPLFDCDWYLVMYPDVAAARMNPYWHYWRHGIREGRDPNPLFATRWYLEQYPDVREQGMDPLDHYYRFGAREGRDPSTGFRTNSYLSEYPDVAARGLNPLLHYLRHGRYEGRSPTPPVETN